MAARRGRRRRTWLGFFLGTPRRFVLTALAITTVALIQHFAPGTITKVANGLVTELEPLLKMLLNFGLVFFLLILAYRILLRAFK